MKKFEELGLSKQTLEILNKVGFTEPTEIQEKAIPLALAGRDIIGGSATGSGKTLAFGSAIIENLKRNGEVQALILTPTRELAEQVAGSIKKFSGNRLKVMAVYGGVSIGTQIINLPNTDVVVGTPGRILDHLERKTLSLNSVKFLVLDEVDKMFDMGFHRDVEKIINRCPKERQTMLFSATISSNVDHLVKKYSLNAAEVSVESYVDTSKLKQVYYDCPKNEKFSLLFHLIREEESDLIMVFCNTRRNVDFITRNLKKNGVEAKAIHGGIPQNRRLKILSDFHGRGVRVLICTDVAARGLDIKGVSHVYNYDLPSGSDEYIHRVGRTARAGKEGKAISIVASGDYENFSNVLRDESLKIDRVEFPEVRRIIVRIDTGGSGFREGRGGFRGGRRDFGRGRRSFGSGGSFGGRERGSGSGRSFGGHKRGFGGSSRVSEFRGREEGQERESEGTGGRRFGGGQGRSFGGRRGGSSRRSFGGKRLMERRSRPQWKRRRH
jgi:ATP-dependent RNA helicase DeaD